MLEQFTTPAGAPVELEIRPETNDHNTAYSALNENEYDLPHGLSGVTWDIGAHIGSVSIALALDNPDLRVIAVEPVPSNANILLRNCLSNGVGDRVTLISGAVGRAGAKVRVDWNYRGNEAAEHHRYIGNSTLGIGTEHETLVYDATSVRDLLEHGRPSFVKIDTEGAEWSFLDSAFAAALPLIVGEWHPVDGHTIGDLIALLPNHLVTFTGPQAGPGGFRAVLR